MSGRDFPIALTVGRVSAAEAQKLIDECTDILRASNQAELTARQLREQDEHAADLLMFAEFDRYTDYCIGFMKQHGVHPMLTFGDWRLLVSAGKRPTV